MKSRSLERQHSTTLINLQLLKSQTANLVDEKLLIYRLKWVKLKKIIKNMASYSLSDLLMRRGITDQNHNITHEIVYFSNFWGVYTKHSAQRTFPWPTKISVLTWKRLN